MKTSSWFTELPADHQRIGISRGVPRGRPAGYRVFRKLAPGPWFNSVGPEEYYRLYRSEILAPLHPRAIFAELTRLSGDRVPVLLCFEDSSGKHFCHRAMAAEWFAETLGLVVPEFGFEHLPQHEHPLMPRSLRRPIVAPEPFDLDPYIGREAMIDGEQHRVIGPSEHPGQAVIRAGEREFSTAFANVARLFRPPA